MYAIGTFAEPGGAPFPGLVIDEQRVIDLDGYGWSDVRQILNGWANATVVIDALAQGPGGVPLEELQTLAPLEPAQILQSGANYRRHVMDIIVAEEQERGNLTRAQALDLGAKIMDERIAAGEPYIFLGAATAVTGPYDDRQRPDHA
jgi:hypothetical protein